MKDYSNNETVCSPCEENFERTVGKLVHDGEAPTAKEHREKAREVEEAYSRQPAGDFGSSSGK